MIGIENWSLLCGDGDLARPWADDSGDGEDVAVYAATRFAATRLIMPRVDVLTCGGTITWLAPTDRQTAIDAMLELLRTPKRAERWTLRDLHRIAGRPSTVLCTRCAGYGVVCIIGGVATPLDDDDGAAMTPIRPCDRCDGHGTRHAPDYKALAGRLIDARVLRRLLRGLGGELGEAGCVVLAASVGDLDPVRLSWPGGDAVLQGLRHDG